MKQILRWLAPVVLLTISCSEETPFNPDQMNSASGNPAGNLNTQLDVPGQGRGCASYEVLQAQLKADPKLQERMDAIERFTEEFVNKNKAGKLAADGITLEIPVYVNVLYTSNATDISNAQIQSQIDVLNKDFSGTNADYNLTPAGFTSVLSGDIKIKFIWDATKVARKISKKTSWSTSDAMKKSKQGGIDPTSPTTTLNIWVCNMSGGILGYAQFPGSSSSTDGVVIDDNAFGTTGLAQPPFDKGRTATHEVGHYFNLRHIWGDTSCGSDQVSDTPTHNTPNYGCPADGHLSTCTGTPVEMTMNYMDYTDDRCMYMFTALQATRMQATYATGGPRASLR